MTRTPWPSLLLLPFLLALTPFVSLIAKPGDTEVRPLPPREEQATFRLPKGFRVDLVASEPDVVDPVCLCFDERGRMYVAEMRGYPNAGRGMGEISSGQIVRLEDRDGDGSFETRTVFADKLRFPMGMQPWRGGLLVAVAPDLIYLEDTDGDGKADKRRVLYDGFNLDNIQQLLNSLQFTLDNSVHGVAGNNGGTVRSAEKKDAPAVTLRARGIRFNPDVPGSLEPTSGGGQYGLSPDDYGHWFTATNSQHLRQIVLPDHYLRRNPALAVSAVTLDIPDHGPACKVHRVSPFEAWRVERTTRRKDGPDASRFASTELIPGGFITSACSPVVYCATAFPEEYRGNVFVCDPANNLIHRDVLVPNGSTFVAKRGDADCEFLASTDNWFRPVHLTLGPDGALYMLDFYREVIETPLSLPDDIKKKLNIESRARGRLWRIAYGDKPAKYEWPNLTKASVADLIKKLDDPNIWWRLTAQRLLFERADKKAVEPLRLLVKEAKTKPGVVHALWTLEGLGSLDEASLLQGLKDTEVGVCEQALRLAGPRLAKSTDLRKAVAALAEDPDARIRMQLAFTLGESDTPECVAALAKVALKSAADPWAQTAVLSSAGKSAPGLLAAVAGDKTLAGDPGAGGLQFVTRLAALVGSQATEEELAKVLGLLDTSGKGRAAWQAALLEGFGQGLGQRAKPIPRLWEQPPAALKDAVARAKPIFERSATTARDAKGTAADRAGATRLLGAGPFALLADAAPDLLTAQAPAEVQLAAVRALTRHDDGKVAELLLSGWAGYSPALRREAAEALLARPGRVSALLDAVAAKKVLTAHLEPSRVEQLRKYPDPKLRKRAQELLAGQTASDRQKVVDDYKAALDLEANVKHGKEVFKKTCSTCHRLENEGFEVGADLMATIKDKPADYLLVAVLDPSREVDPRYLNYLVTTKKGQTLSGMLASETATSITLRRGEKAEDTILRDQIDEIRATSKSVMPEGLEMQLSKQNVADLIAYLREATRSR